VEEEVVRSKTNPRRAAICKDDYDNYYIEFNSYDSVQLDTIAAYLNYPTEEAKVYKDGDKPLWRQDWANFVTYEEPIDKEGEIDKGKLKDFKYGKEPNDILTFDEDMSFYAVLDDDGFLRKLYFNMSKNRKTALINQFGDPESTDEATRAKA
jgi:hypothetical protein